MLRSPMLRLLLVLAAGCASEGGPAAAPAASDDSAGGKADGATLPTITFAADWSETLTGRLRERGAARLEYDLDRIGDCHGTQGGIPQWGATAVYWGEDGAEQTLGLTEIVGDEIRATDAVFSVPEGEELTLYVYVSNRWGCIAYDSDYGANYRFPVDPAPEPAVVSFGADDPEPTVTGDLYPGSAVTVEYDLERLTECRSTRGAYPAWEVAVRYRFDDYGREQERSLTRSSSVPSGREPAPAMIYLPHDAETLELTFRNFDVYGCEAWDPAFGEAYTLPLGETP